MKQRRPEWIHDFFLPALLFAALGAMTWAIRGSTGFGGTAGCIFAGVAWGTAWWFVAQEPMGNQRRRYSSGMAVLALTVGIGLAGARGWMQWPSFFEGKLYTNYARGEFVPISPAYGFLWLAIAGIPWAGIGACLLAWTAPAYPLGGIGWVLRVASGLSAAWLASWLFHHYPSFFLPLYDSLADRYQNLGQNPSLGRLINDCAAAILHLGLYLGLLGFELARRDWGNVTLITSVGLMNGAGWALCRNWRWASETWPGVRFNWWRCWESSGGISIGVALGLAYFLVNRPRAATSRGRDFPPLSVRSPRQWSLVTLLLASMPLVFYYRIGSPWSAAATFVVMLFAVGYWQRHLREGRGTDWADSSGNDVNLERLGIGLGLILGLGVSLRQGALGWLNIYRGGARPAWLGWFGPLLFVAVALLCLAILTRPRTGQKAACSPRERNGAIALVLITQNLIAQLVTGPLTIWNEFVFNVYYLLLAAITAVIAIHYGWRDAQDGVCRLALGEARRR